MSEALRITNQELREKNEELEARAEEPARTNVFLESILASVESVVVMIDRDFEILLWNPRAEDLWDFREGEGKGSSLLSLNIGLPVNRLAEPVREFLAREDGEEEQTLSPRPSTGVISPLWCTSRTV